jgi:hypothetical protein
VTARRWTVHLVPEAAAATNAGITREMGGMSVAARLVMHKLIVIGLAFSAVLLGFGCARSEVTSVKGPDGQEWLAISCKDNAQNCWRAAGEVCAGGWETASEVSSQSHGFLFFGRHMRDEMLVRCKTPDRTARIAD